MLPTEEGRGGIAATRGAGRGRGGASAGSRDRKRGRCGRWTRCDRRLAHGLGWFGRRGCRGRPAAAGAVSTRPAGVLASTTALGKYPRTLVGGPGGIGRRRNGGLRLDRARGSRRTRGARLTRRLGLGLRLLGKRRHHAVEHDDRDDPDQRVE
ncbi:MAG: hypothetical protein ACK55I_28085, partial [bacterium]